MNDNPESQIILYQTEDGETQIQVTMQDETVWLTQKEMAELFQRDKSVISRHINNVFKEGELDRESTVAKIATVQQEGRRTITREVEYYNLDVIISVGQSKFHYAIHGRTAAELIAERVNSDAPAMGLTNLSGKIVTTKDARIAKNYLQELELKRFDLLVEQFLVYAELQAVEKRPMYMSQWVEKLDEFLRFNEKEILQHKGLVSRQDMEAWVREELQKFNENAAALEAGDE